MNKRLWTGQILLNVSTILIVALMLFAYRAWAAPAEVTPPALVVAEATAAPQIPLTEAANTSTVVNATPGVITYQATLTDANGKPINATLTIVFRLYSTPTGGTALWTETRSGANAVPVQNGLLNVNLGSLTPIPGSVWDNSPLYLSVQVGSEVLSPRELVGAVPVALNVPVSTEWADLPLAEEFFSPPNDGWQKAQYRIIGDIVYLRGLVSRSGWVNIENNTMIATLPVGFRPPIRVAFVTEPHNWLTTKHRVDVDREGRVIVAQTAGATPHVSLDGIFFSVTP